MELARREEHGENGDGEAESRDARIVVEPNGPGKTSLSRASARKMQRRIREIAVLGRIRHT